MSGSYRYDQMTSMGVTNAGWGVCGFTSSLYAMYHLNPGARGRLINAPQAFTILAEIKTYLEMLYAAGETALLQDIEDFTRSFGVVGNTDFGKFTPRLYILYINDAATKYIGADDSVDDDIYGDGKFSIGMPPHAVVDYLQRIWGYKATVKPMDSGTDAIVGVRNGTIDNSGKMYGGLIHYLYRKDQRYYSWGKHFVSLADAKATYQICWSIEIKKP